MSPHETLGVETRLILVVINTFILAMGLLITYFSFKAYRRTNERPLLELTAGFGLITLGALSGGFVHQVLGADLIAGVLVDSVLTFLGLGVILFSLYTERA